jgi:hypothetical protein
MIKLFHQGMKFYILRLQLLLFLLCCQQHLQLHLHPLLLNNLL